MKLLVMLLACGLACPAMAQQASYQIKEYVINTGGDPTDGVVLTSSSYRITLDSIGESITTEKLSGVSFSLDGGFAMAFPPPTEVRGLVFDDDETLRWLSNRSASLYNLYRDDTGSVVGGGYGECLQLGLSQPTTNDFDPPAPGESFFYLVTSVNRLSEEGTKGWDSFGAVRPNPNPCP